MESLNKPIRYDLAHLRQEFFKILNDFANRVRSEKVRNALGKKTLEYLETQITQIHTRLAAEFCLVVIGEFKRGKSTLINALLGESVVTIDVEPETVTINQIKYGSTPKYEVCLVNGGRVTLEKKELKKELLIPILEQYTNRVSHISIEQPIEWLRGLRLVDTPGTGDILNRFDRQVHEYLLQADAVIFVISANAPFAESEEKFLGCSVIPQDFPKVLFVLNFMDMDNIRTDEEAERLLNSTQLKIKRFLQDAPLFGISAYDEFCRLQSEERPNPKRASTLEVGFNRFRECLEEFLQLNRDFVKLDRGTDHLDQMLQEFANSLAWLDNAIQLDRSRLDEAIAQCEDKKSELSTIIEQKKQALREELKQMSEQACQWMKEFFVRIEEEAIVPLANYNFDDIRRHFRFFLTNKLSQAINMCLAGHKSTIDESTQKIQQEIFTDFQRLTNISLLEKDTTASNVCDILWEYSTYTDPIELIIRQIKDCGNANESGNYKQEMLKVTEELKRSVLKEIPLIYQSLANKIVQGIETYYQQNILASLSAMQQVQEYVQQAEKGTSINEGLAEAKLLLKETRESLTSLKQKLCSEVI